MEEEKQTKDPLYKRIGRSILTIGGVLVISATLGLITASIVYSFLLGWGVIF